MTKFLCMSITIAIHIHLIKCEVLADYVELLSKCNYKKDSMCLMNNSVHYKNAKTYGLYVYLS